MGPKNFAFPTSSQVVMLLLFGGPHSEINHWTGISSSFNVFLKILKQSQSFKEVGNTVQKSFFFFLLSYLKISCQHHSPSPSSTLVWNSYKQRYSAASPKYDHWNANTLLPSNPHVLFKICILPQHCLQPKDPVQNHELH